MFFKAPRWLVVFLGNPGDRYNKTRHNVGFMAADLIEERLNIRIKRIKYNALTAVCHIGGGGGRGLGKGAGIGRSGGGEHSMLMKPQTYMNLSGRSVSPAAAFYKIPPERIIVVSDDVNLETGKLRIRRKGSAGGHNGLRSIISELGSDEFNRVRIGVGSPENPNYEMPDWVLGKFEGKDLKLISGALEDAVDAVETIILEGVDQAMSRFNGLAPK